MKNLRLVFLFFLLAVKGYSQFTEGFEGTTAPPAPAMGAWGSWALTTGTWQIYNKTGPAITWTRTSTASVVYSGTYAALLNAENVATGTVAEDWLVTPGINLTGISNPQLRFNSRLGVNIDQGSIYKVLISTTSQTSSSAFTQLQSWTELQINPSQLTYGEITVNLTGYTGTVYLAFVMTTDAGDRWHIDNVRVRAKCPDTDNLSVTDLTTNSAKLIWDNPGGVGQFEVDHAVQGQPLDGIPDATVSTNYYNVSGLTSNQTYRYYVRSKCGSTGTNNDNMSGWVGPYQYTTYAPGGACNVAQVIPNTTAYIKSGEMFTGYGTPYSGSPGVGCGFSADGLLNGGWKVYSYTPAAGTTSINVNVISQTSYNTGVFVYDSCANIGVNCIAGSADPSTLDESITNLAVTPGVTYYIMVAGLESSKYSISVAKNNCTTNMAANFNIQSDCALSSGFSVVANVTSMGGATSILATPIVNGVEQTSANQSYTLAGQKTFGPFGANDNVQMRLQSNQNTNCFIVSNYISKSDCPPSNDECQNAIDLSVGIDGYCAAFKGTLKNATASLQPNTCAGDDNDDVWFEFTAQGPEQLINFSAISGNVNIYHAVYMGTCGNLVQINCGQENHNIITGLITGQVYKIRVYSETSSPVSVTFDICTLGTPYTCMDNNPNAANVKNAFIALINHLISVGPTLPGNPYDCPQLTALSPYISATNPLIYDFTMSGGYMRFSFSDNQPIIDVQIVTQPPGEVITNMFFYSYLTPTGIAEMAVEFSSGDIYTYKSYAKLIEFCPETPPCNPVAGNIKITPGISCMVVNQPHGFSLDTDAANIEDYTWIVYNSSMQTVAVSSVQSPVFTIATAGNYTIQVIVNTSDGCDTTIQKTFTVATNCDYCTETNPQAVVVKNLYIDLVNYLLQTYCSGGSVSTISTPFNCPALTALAPYVTDGGGSPLIYNLSYNITTGILQFSFADHGAGTYDIAVKNNGVITDIDILSFTSATVAANRNTIYANGSVYASHSIKHVNFCPGNCAPITGTINLDSGISCIVTNTPKMFNFETTSSIVTGYTWTFYAIGSTTTVLTSSTASHPTVTYTAAGTYQIKLVLNYGSGCTATFWKSVTVGSAATCQGCTEQNNVSPAVKQLYINLVNHLLATGGLVSNPYTCPQLEALSPYISENNPQIWNLTYTSGVGGLLKFSFNNHGTEYDVSVPTSGQISDINLINYTSSSTAQNFSTIYTSGTTAATHSVRHVEFCPLTDCTPLLGEIKLNQGLSCSQINVEQSFHLQANTSNIIGYQWSFYNQAGNLFNGSTDADPVMTYNSTGNYLVKVVVTENTGCKTTFYKTITVSATCSNGCTETNQESEDVKDLYVALLNHLLDMQSIPNGYTCMELSMLAEYITDSNPAIYNAVWNGQVLSFSFASSDSQPDVVIGNYGTVGDINLFNFSSSTATSSLLVTYTNGTVSSSHTVKHINFCPVPGACQSHVAFVIDESASIDAAEAFKIKVQLTSFIEQQLEYGAETTISFIGMSDSDDNTRTDHVYSKVTLDSKQDFDNWIANYKSAYTTARQNIGISANSDYWLSGLKQAMYGYDLEPDIVIVITDGSQTGNLDELMDVIEDINIHSHLYVYGIGTGYYVDEDPFDVDPNNPAMPVSDVTDRLMSSLKYLMQLAPSAFPVSNQGLLAGSYYEYENFNHLAEDTFYFSDKLAAADIGCGGEVSPRDYCADCETFQPFPSTEESSTAYWISGWVKEDLNIQVKTYTNASIRLIFENAGEDVVGDISFLPTGDIIDGWQRIAAKFEIPENASTMHIGLENASPSVPVYFDDIRIHPLNGSVKSFVYDPETLRLMAELDDNNYSTFYEYDNEGGLVRIKKETSKGIKTIQESRSGTPIQN